MELFFKMQFMKNVLVYVFCVFTFSFCYCYCEGFIHKIILVSQVLPFICVSYLIKVFKLDAEILRDSCAVPLLKTLSRLPQSIAFLCLVLFLMFACNDFPHSIYVFLLLTLRESMVHGFDSISIAQFPAMICSVSAEASLNRVAHSI